MSETDRDVVLEFDDEVQRILKTVVPMMQARLGKNKLTSRQLKEVEYLVRGINIRIMTDMMAAMTAEPIETEGMQDEMDRIALLYTTPKGKIELPN